MLTACACAASSTLTIGRAPGAPTTGVTLASASSVLVAAAAVRLSGSVMFSLSKGESRTWSSFAAICISHSKPSHVPQIGKKSPAAFAATALAYMRFAAAGTSLPPPGKSAPLTWPKSSSTSASDAWYGRSTTRAPAPSSHLTSARRGCG